MRPEDSVAFQTVQAALPFANAGKLKIEVLLYDNTVGKSDPGTLPANVRYERATHNAGLAAAYNRALEIAEAEKCTWLLTMDQDTGLPEHYFDRLGEYIFRVSSDSTIAAIVPQILDGGRLISPGWWLWDSIPRLLSIRFSGVTRRYCSAFNSASALRVSALLAIGGYNPRFWLDCSDMYIYRMFYKNGMHLYVAGDLQVTHELSIMDMNERVSLARYRNILSAGCAFWDLELGWLAAADFNLRLLYRIFYKHWRNGHIPAFRQASIDMLRKRVLHSRNRRIEEWMRETDRWVVSSRL
jgi:GT2 family glycosyltransferase